MLDGKTTNPFEYTGTGDNGKRLEDCEKYPICDFDAIEANMPCFSEEAKHQQSCDQKYFYEIVSAIETGYVSKRLANLYLGKMAHFCWLTTANRVMRLYVSVSKPSDMLKNSQFCGNYLRT